MKQVYMIIECSGEYEDYHERCVAAYFQKEKAWVKRDELEGIAEQRREQCVKCDNCHNRYLYSINNEDEFERFLESPPSGYCDYLKNIEWNEEWELVTCDNSCRCWYDNVTYRIDTLEVEE